MSKTRITANISQATKRQLDKYLKQHGIKKAFMIEDALQHYMQAMNYLPQDVMIPSQLTVTTDAMATITARLDDAAEQPTDELRALMHVSTMPDVLHFSFDHQMGGPVVSFDWVDGRLRFVEKDAPNSHEPPDDAIRLLQPDPLNWGGFWSAMNQCGVWYWGREYLPNTPCLDGVIWELRLAHDGRSVTSVGFNSYPNDGSTRMPERFRQLFLAFGRLMDDKDFIDRWYRRYRELFETDDDFVICDENGPENR